MREYYLVLVVLNLNFGRANSRFDTTAIDAVRSIGNRWLSWSGDDAMIGAEAFCVLAIISIPVRPKGEVSTPPCATMFDGKDIPQVARK